MLFIGGQEQAPFFASPLWKARQQSYAVLPTPYWTFGGPRSTAAIATQVREAIEAMNR